MFFIIIFPAKLKVLTEITHLEIEFSDISKR